VNEKRWQNCLIDRPKKMEKKWEKELGFTLVSEALISKGKLIAINW